MKLWHHFIIAGTLLLASETFALPKFAIKALSDLKPGHRYRIENINKDAALALVDGLWKQRKDADLLKIEPGSGGQYKLSFSNGLSPIYLTRVVSPGNLWPYSLSVKTNGDDSSSGTHLWELRPMGATGKWQIYHKHPTMPGFLAPSYFMVESNKTLRISKEETSQNANLHCIEWYIIDEGPTPVSGGVCIDEGEKRKIYESGGYKDMTCVQGHWFRFGGACAHETRLLYVKVNRRRVGYQCRSGQWAPI